MAGPTTVQFPVPTHVPVNTRRLYQSQTKLEMLAIEGYCQLKVVRRCVIYTVA